MLGTVELHNSHLPWKLYGHFGRYWISKETRDQADHTSLRWDRSVARMSKYYPLLPCFFSTFAHVSFNATVRLKTGAPVFESASAQK